jgi:ribulose-phosphate 3-epimerase
MSIKIAASILSADFSRLGQQVQEAVEAGADYIHVDIMDGHFVPNMTIGPLVVRAIKPIALAGGVPLDVHLMIENPDRLIPDFARAGADIITVHVETCPHMHRTLQHIRELGVKPGVTLNPGTSLVTIEEIIAEVEQVLVMSVNPGFGGQAYIPATSGKITRLREMLVKRGLDQVDIEVDGGIKAGNAGQVVMAGANVLVVGSGIFNKKASVAENIRALRKAVQSVGPGTG